MSLEGISVLRHLEWSEGPEGWQGDRFAASGGSGRRGRSGTPKELSKKGAVTRTTWGYGPMDPQGVSAPDALEGLVVLVTFPYPSLSSARKGIFWVKRQHLFFFWTKCKNDNIQLKKQGSQWNGCRWVYPDRYGGRYYKGPLWKGSKSGSGKCVCSTLFFHSRYRGGQRVLCQFLNKLHIPDVVDDHKIRSLIGSYWWTCGESISQFTKGYYNSASQCPLRDSVSNNASTKFETSITKKFENQLEFFSEEEFWKLEELNALFMFLDSIIPLEDNGDEVDVPKRSKKRCVHRR